MQDGPSAGPHLRVRACLRTRPGRLAIAMDGGLEMVGGAGIEPATLAV